MKLFRNRTVLGILCIVVSLVICFGITPLYNKGLSQKETIVRVSRAVKEGEQLTRSVLKEVEVGSYNLPDNVFRSMEEVEGMYTTANLVVDDYILDTKVSAEPAAENKYLYSLTGEKQAISITIDSFAQGLSGKLESGDIVSVIAPNYQGRGETVTPAEPQYVEVIAVTAKSGYDANTGEETEEKELPSTVSLLVKPEQGRVLARLESEGEIHLSLVFRGEDSKARKFIEAQDAVVEELKKASEGAEAEGQDGSQGSSGQNNGSKSVGEIMEEHSGRIGG